MEDRTVTGARRRRDDSEAASSEAEEVMAEEAMAEEVMAEEVMAGRYAVLEEIGRGGMGRVLRGYDPRLRREVALKVVRRRQLDEDAQARLVREARAMAQLSHPNVVTIHDVEADAQGRIVVAMELVRGTNLRRWLETPRRWPEVLGRFVEAGRGLSAAHRAGLLHRDFKPANVLLGDDGRVRVADFGLARPVSPSGEDESEAPRSDLDAISGSSDRALTGAGALIGTLAFMAPEQHDAGELTEAADQFAFCASLWTALAGRPPYGADTEVDLAAHKRGGPPPWPGEVKVPARVVRALRRGLAPLPRERWPSMDALLAQLERARTRTARTVVRVVSAVAVVGLVASLWITADTGSSLCKGASSELVQSWSPARRAEVQENLRASGLPYAPRVADEITAALERYGAAWRDSYTDACEATHVRGDQSAQMMDARMRCLDRARAALDARVGILSESGPAIVDRAHAVVDGLPALHRCADVDPQREPALSEPGQAVARDLARVRALGTAGQMDEARSLAAACRTRADELGIADLQAESRLLHAKLVHNTDAPGAEVSLGEALEQALTAGLDARALEIAGELVFVVGVLQDRHDAAESYVHLARGLVQRPEIPYRARAGFHQHLGGLRRVQRRAEEALAHYQRAYELFVQARGADHPENAGVRAALAGALFELGRLDEAEATVRAAIEQETANYGEAHPGVILNTLNLGLLIEGRGRYAEAEALLRDALARAEQHLGDNHRTAYNGRTYLSRTLQQQDKNEEALALIERNAEQLDADPSAPLRLRAQARMNLASSLSRLERYDEAVDAARKALPMLETHGDDHPELADARRRTASYLRQGRRYAEAVPLVAWVEDPERGPEDAGTRGDAAFELARALWADEAQRERALAAADLAKRYFEAAGAAQADRLAKVVAWIASPQ